jgi:hypothetical protein
MSATPTHSRASACNPAGTKKGAPAETGRAQIKADQMLNTLNTTTNIKQGIGNTVTVLDDKELARVRREEERATQWFAERMLRAEDEVFSEVVTITPTIAKLMLRRNPDNRNIRAGKLAGYKADLESGRWTLNGEPIVISKGGLLNDGQHRLTAVVETGVPMKALIVFGVSRSSRLTLDQGIDRKLVDILHMGGHKENADGVGAVARLMSLLEKTGTLKPRFGRAAKMAGVTRSEAHGTAIDNEAEIQRSLLLCRAPGFSKLGSLASLAFTHLMLARVNREAADAFMTALISGADLKQGTPLYLARERLLTVRRAKAAEVFETIVRGWNAARTGKEITYIRVTGSALEIKG